MKKSILNFLNSPLGYVVESIENYLDKFPLRYSPWLKKTSDTKYSIVSAVYGAESYLEDFFVSITNQTLIFEEHIELIMVNDGSLDGSAKIIEKWVKKYPNNIFYLKKENGGQASARNLGMTQVTNDWVTFIDPDDFINKKYFETIDKLVASEKNLAMISCNFILFYERSGRFRDTHPLRYRFVDKKVSCFTIPNLGNNIQLAANSALFRAKIIKKYKLEMHTQIKPTFEDAYFVSEYLLLCKSYKIAFLREAKYFYRKRKERSSAIDTSWAKKEQYLSKLKNGYLGLLKLVEEKEVIIPDFIQRMILYDLFWYFQRLVNHEERLSLLSNEEKKEFEGLLHQIFGKIDERIIKAFELAGCGALYKTAWLCKFKQHCDDNEISELKVESYDATKHQVKVSYFFNENPHDGLVLLNQCSVKPIYEKVRVHSFNGSHFVLQKIMWLSLNDESEILSATIGGKSSNLLLGDKRYSGAVSIAEIIKHFSLQAKKGKDYTFGLRLLRGLAKLSVVLPWYQNAWIFMDRDVQADDNAEHLYRHVSNKDLNINTRFILRKTSHDWNRLKKEGFRLIPFGSIRHMVLMFNAKHLVSSHADNYVVNFPPHSWFNGILNYKYTFLQHGITKDDISNWLNNKSIDLFITASEKEYLSISGKQNKYKYTDKEVHLTGFARHDALLSKSQADKNEKKPKTLLIMPTWRESLVGKTYWMSNNRRVNDVFYTSDYAKYWKSFLHSKNLKKLVDDGLEVVFFPHANVSNYIDWFDVPPYISQFTHQADNSIQDLFVSASIMLTDYSSVAFEVAYLEKPVIYYQFDREAVFSGGHLTAKGYFDYTKDGFGPVCEKESQVFLSLNDILNSNSQMDSDYLQRVNKTFQYQDTNSCERIYKAIINMDKKAGI